MPTKSISIERHISCFVVACCLRALSACDPVEYASVVEIVPKTCDFWRYSGEVRSAEGAIDAKDTVKWGKDCGEPENYKRLRFSQGSGRDFAIDSNVISKPDPDTISNAGSKVQFQLRGCNGQVESTAIEAIYRPVEGDTSTVAYLEYSSRSEGSSWNFTINRFSLASFQFDFISTTADETLGDRLARATIGAAADGASIFSASLCGKTLDPYKWKVEFFTSNAEIRRAIVGVTVAKAVRDDRRDGPSGEEVPSQCRATFLALSVGLPLLLSLLGATVLLLLMRRRRRRATMPVEGSGGGDGDLEAQTQIAVMASLEAHREATPARGAVNGRDHGGGTGLGAPRGQGQTGVAPWEAALGSGGAGGVGGGPAAATTPKALSKKPLLRQQPAPDTAASPKKAAWELELERAGLGAGALQRSVEDSLPSSPLAPAPPAQQPRGMASPSRFRPAADRGGPSRWHSASGAPSRVHTAHEAGWRSSGNAVRGKPGEA